MKTKLLNAFSKIRYLALLMFLTLVSTHSWGEDKDSIALNSTTVLSFAFAPITSQKWLLDAYYQYIIGMKKKKSAVEHSTNSI